MPIPHLESFSGASCKDRWHVTVNNHVRRLLWTWWEQAANGQTHVELDGELYDTVDGNPWDVETRDGVRKALVVSNNGEDFSLFVDWVAGYTYDVVDGRVRLVRTAARAPTQVVNALMNTTRRRTGIGIVWKHCVRRFAEGRNLYELRS